MNEGTRTKNSIKNIIVNILHQLDTHLTSMISRRVFADALGSEYMGLSGLFNNILSLLSLTELGISSAIMYNLYKPVAEDDRDRVARLINFYKQLYRIIGIIVFIIGISVVPFLKYIINLESQISNIVQYYLLFLINSCLSYFCVYKTAVIIADQKGYKIKIITIAATVLKTICQIIVLKLFVSYGLYLFVQMVFTFGGNFLASVYSAKKYPFIGQKIYLDKSEKKNILYHVKDMFSYKIGAVILNNTDNILISALVSTKTVGVYSNYCVLVQAVTSFASLVFTSLQSSVANFIVSVKSESRYKMFKILTFAAFWIYAFTATGLMICIEDVIYIWLGGNYIMPQNVLYVCVFNFYLTGVLYPIWCYRDTIGLFRQTRNIMFITSAVNLVLSYVLGMWMGIVGILLATGLSRILTTIWYEPYILFKVYFGNEKKELIKYYVQQVIYSAEVIIILCVTQFLCSVIYVESRGLLLLLKIILCCIIPNVLIFIMHFRQKEFKEICKYIMNFFKR